MKQKVWMVLIVNMAFLTWAGYETVNLAGTDTLGFYAALLSVLIFLTLVVAVIRTNGHQIRS